MKPVIFSYGGGWQSVYIITLILSGKLARPERIVMADTGRERTAVLEYLEELVRPALKRVGLQVEVAPHALAKVDLISHKGDLLIPVYTGNGKLPTFCSNEWKKYVVRRYLKNLGYGKTKPVVMWFGMSLDEVERMRANDVQWIQNYYPLCQDASVRARRHECALGIERFGWPIPPKSACVMCPHRDNATWLEIKTNEPGDWEEAVRIDELIREGGKWGDVYLHGDRIPLKDVDFTAPHTHDLFDTCANSCWT